MGFGKDGLCRELCHDPVFTYIYRQDIQAQSTYPDAICPPRILTTKEKHEHTRPYRYAGPRDHYARVF